MCGRGGEGRGCHRECGGRGVESLAQVVILALQGRQLGRRLLLKADHSQAPHDQPHTKLGVRCGGVVWGLRTSILRLASWALAVHSASTALRTRCTSCLHHHKTHHHANSAPLQISPPHMACGLEVC